MPLGTHILPKALDQEHDHKSQRPEKSRRTGKLTKIACYECRKRKCKCDGRQPVCGPCQGRNVPCDFDTVSGSANTEELKNRIRQLEANNHSLASDVGLAHDQNTSLHAEIQRLSDELGRTQHQSLWNSRLSSEDSFLVSSQQQISPQYDQGFSMSSQAPDDATIAGLADHSESHITSPVASDINKALERFLNNRRQTLSVGHARGDGATEVLPPLDVTPLFRPDHEPDELSYWALQLPMANLRLTHFAKLADAYVSYHQLRWIILPTEETASMMPDFVRMSSLTELCVPNPVDISIIEDVTFKAPLVRVHDLPLGSNATTTSTLLASTVTPWPRTIEDAAFFEAETGKMRLTPDFEAYIRDSRNWMLNLYAGRSRHASFASETSMIDV